jgi:hypothetical protein
MPVRMFKPRSAIYKTTDFKTVKALCDILKPVLLRRRSALVMDERRISGAWRAAVLQRSGIRSACWRGRLVIDPLCR